MEAELLVALEQLEAVEAALLTHPADADLLRAKAELTELLTLSSLLHAPTANLVDAGAEDGDGDKGVADMFGGNDDEWERTHKREFELHTERQKQAFSTSSSATPASSVTTSSSSSSTKRSGEGDDVEGEQAGWLACRVVVTESLGGGFGGPRQRRVWREGLLHSRAPDDAGRYRVTLLHSRLVHEVRAEDVLLQGATLKHLNHHAKAGDDGGRKRKRRRVGGGESEDDEEEESSGSDDGFAGFSLMRATGGHDYVVGAWESHTSGIGSRLLARMGYTPGKGLGRGGEGIVKPLGIGLKAPSRKKELLGLGHDERTSKRGNDGGDGADDDGEGRRSQAFDEAGNPIPRKRRRGGKKSRNKKAAAARDDEGEKKTSDVFGFLNEIGQVGGTAKTGGGGGGGGEERQKREREQEKREDGYKKMSAKELQDSLKKKIIEKDDVSSKIKHLEESVQRNKDRDPAMAAQAKQRMREARTRLHTLHAEIKELATRVKIKEGTKKTIVF